MMTIPEIIELLKSVHEGKLIQRHELDGSWSEGTCLTASFAIYLINNCAELRVKPEPPKPREVWAVYDADSVIQACFSSEVIALDFCKGCPGLSIVHFIEDMAATTK